MKFECMRQTFNHLYKKTLHPAGQEPSPNKRPYEAGVWVVYSIMRNQIKVKVKLDFLVKIVSSYGGYFLFC